MERAHMTTASASYSITMQLLLDREDATAIGRVTTTIGETGGGVAVDVVEASDPPLVVDLTANARGASHASEIVGAVERVNGVHVHKASDRIFLLHLKGKIEMRSTLPLKTRDDLSMAYTPGVARISQAIAEQPDDVCRLTMKGNTIAIVTDGSTVLGLGDVGPRAALPVMEGEAVLFKRVCGS